MNSVFVIQNQHGQFLSRHREWVDKTDIKAVYKTPHRDLAINEWVELTARDPEVRAKVVAAETSSKGLPLLSTLPPLEFPRAALPDELTTIDRREDELPAEKDADAAASFKPASKTLDNPAISARIPQVI